MEEFLHREQNAQITDLRNAAAEMIQKVSNSIFNCCCSHSIFFLVSRRSRGGQSALLVVAPASFLRIHTLAGQFNSQEFVSFRGGGSGCSIINRSENHFLFSTRWLFWPPFCDQPSVSTSVSACRWVHQQTSCNLAF